MKVSEVANIGGKVARCNASKVISKMPRTFYADTPFAGLVNFNISRLADQPVETMTGEVDPDSESLEQLKGELRKLGKGDSVSFMVSELHNPEMFFARLHWHLSGIRENYKGMVEDGVVRIRRTK